MYYDFENEIVVTVGSIEAITASLVTIIDGKKNEIVLFSPSYASYAEAVKVAGGKPIFVNLDEKNGWSVDFEALAKKITANTAGILFANPNNPTGSCFSRRALLDMARQLEARQGWLIVDEAFADADNGGDSLADIAGTGVAGNIIVLRSIGKFFGLAGARVGFAIACDSILTPLAESIGPWALAHPSRFATRAALADADWQSAQRARLQRDGARLHELLAASGLGTSTGTALFRYLARDDALELHEFFARQGILLRYFARPAAVRFGLPATEAGWQRLAATLDQWKNR